jgi:hypothetical protein
VANSVPAGLNACRTDITEIVNVTDIDFVHRSDFSFTAMTCLATAWRRGGRDLVNRQSRGAKQMTPTSSIPPRTVSRMRVENYGLCVLDGRLRGAHDG